MSIKPKPKPCKGTGKAHGYGCGKSTLHRVYGLGKMCGCYSEWLLHSDAGKVKLKKSFLKPKRPNTTKASTELKKAHAATKKAVHDYVKQRDKGKPCISCGKPYQKNFQACHFYKAELFETLRYNLDNLHSGCPECNLFLEGNLTMYAGRLPLRIGTERFKELQKLASVDKIFSKVWNIENLKEIQQNLK